MCLLTTSLVVPYDAVMFKQALLGTTCFLAGLLTAVGITSQADTGLRFEGAIGHATHRLADDTNWHYQYGTYETNMNLSPSAYQLGVSWMPYWKGFGDVRLGVRAAYVNLGQIKANNTFPLDEPAYMAAKEAGTAVASETSHFTGHGSSNGLTLGLAAEVPVWGGLSVGAEVGAAYLYSRWKAYFRNKEEETYGCGVGWSCADGFHATAYAGLSARYETPKGWPDLFVGGRVYANAHASQSAKNPLFIGPTTGPVKQILFGISIPL